MTSRLPQWHHRFVPVISIALVVLFGSRRATAQGADSEALFDEATRLMAQGEIAKACETFEAANQAKPSAGTLIGLGFCREKNQQLASAWSAYNEAASRAKDARKRKFASDRVADLGARLSQLTVSVSNENQVEGLTLTRNGEPFDPPLWNRALPVDGGDYVIAGQAPGHEAWQTTVHVATEGAKISVDVPRLAELGKLAAPPPQPVVSAPTPPPRPVLLDRETTQSASSFTTRRKVAMGAAGASLISVAIGVVLGVSANGKKHDAYNLCPDPAMPCTGADQSDALIKAAHSRGVQANIAFGIGAVAAVGAGVLWFIGAPAAEDPAHRVSLVPSLALGQAGLVLIGSF